MKVRAVLSLITLTAVLIMYSTQDLRAAGAAASESANRVHAVSSAGLHEAVLVSQQQADEARKTLQSFLARPDVRTQIQRFGLSPEKVENRLAMLSDADLLRLQNQIMSADMQKGTAGLSGAAIALIVIAAVGGVILLLVLLYYLADDESIYYY